MVESALLGDDPLTTRDAAIAKAMREYRTIFSANPKHPFGPSRPKPPLPDLANESNAWRVLTAASCFLVLVIIVFAGRCYFRWKRRKQMGWGVDDVLIVPAAALAIFYIAQIIQEVTASCLGKHMWFCTYEDAELLYSSFTIDQLMWYFSVYCSKLSLFFFIRRLTIHSMSPLYHFINIGLFTAVLLAGLTSVFMTALQCTPFSARWSYISLSATDPADYRCIDNLKSQTALRALHIATDILLLLYPATILHRTQLPRKKKIAISLVFCLGLFSVVCSIVRNIIFGYTRPDETYMIHDIDIWNMADVSSACMTASLPAHYPLFVGLYRTGRRWCGKSTVEDEAEEGDAPRPRAAGSKPKSRNRGSRLGWSQLSRSRTGQAEGEDVLISGSGHYTSTDGKSSDNGDLNLVGDHALAGSYEAHVEGPDAPAKTSPWRKLSVRGREGAKDGPSGKGKSLRRNVVEMVDRSERKGEADRSEAAV